MKECLHTYENEKRITIDITPELWQFLKEEARKEGMLLAPFLRRIFTRMYKEKQAENKTEINN